MRIGELHTPALFVERNILQRNIARASGSASEQGVRLRPHVKTHKSVDIARLQLAAGATGITVAKPGEAEVFAAAGFSDIRLAYTIVGSDACGRLAALMNRARVSFCVDTIQAASAASVFFREKGLQPEVLVEVDVGYGRCGVRWDRRESIEFVREVAVLPGIKVCGILTHAGHAYAGPSHESESSNAYLQRISNEERDRMLEFAAALFEADIPNLDPTRFEISIGSTPTISRFTNRKHNGVSITEIRPGNYALNDGIQVALGVATVRDCALTVNTRVVSKHRNARSYDRLFLDAGKKVLTSDTGYRTSGYGTLLHSPSNMTPLPHARLTRLSEEHAWVEVPGGSTLEVGDQIRVLPNHACTCVATQDQMFLVDGDEVLQELRIDARGCVS